MPERLRRLDEVYARTPIYFVTACVADRRHLLATDSIHETFKRFADDGPRYGAWVGDYVLMPDHLHLFLALDGERMSLSCWMQSLKGAISKVLRDNEISTPHWQKGFFDHVLRSSDSYSAKWQYVKDNPVRAGLVKQSEDWPYQGQVFALEYRRDR